MRRLSIIFVLVLIWSFGCGSPGTGRNSSPELTIAAAANLTDAFAEVGNKFTQKTGIRVTFSFGATADLAKQIENGAPFDLFASADSQHVEQLEQKGLLSPGSRALYARGRLVMWFPPGSNLSTHRVHDLTGEKFERIAIAKPDVAPYGRATVEALEAMHLWKEIEPKVVYAQNVSQTKQYAATGNAEVAFIPLALVKPGEGSHVEILARLHGPIDQALGIIKDSPRQIEAQQFKNFLLSEEGQALLEAKGYHKAMQQR